MIHINFWDDVLEGDEGHAYVEEDDRSEESCLLILHSLMKFLALENLRLEYHEYYGGMCRYELRYVHPNQTELDEQLQFLMDCGIHLFDERFNLYSES